MEFDHNFSTYLPKWPQHVVLGDAITVDQASEVIRRTDMFFEGHGGNDRQFNRRLRKELGMPVDTLELRLHEGFDFNAHWKAEQKWKEAWGSIDLEYLYNGWVSSAFIFGPHGWCHPSGKIAFFDNIGKYPNDEDVFKEWRRIAAAFPFLKLDSTLWSGESCEEQTRPLIGFKIRNGEVETVAGTNESLYRDFGFESAWAAREQSGEIVNNDPNRPAGFQEAAEKIAFGSLSREHGVPQDMINRWIEYILTLNSVD